MRKKWIALAMTLANTLLLTGFSQPQADSDVLNRQKAVALVRENTAAVWDASQNVKFAKKDYDKQVIESEKIDTKKTTFYNPWTDEDENFYYDAKTQMQLRFMKEFMPAQMKYVWEVRQKALAVTENAMANTADNLFLGMYTAYQNRIFAQKSLELAEGALEREQIRYDSGLITKLDLESYILDVATQKNAIIKAERDFDNTHRQFNSLAGLPLDYRFALVGTPWVNQNKITITEEQAVTSALENRMTLWDIRQQILLTLKRLEIYHHENVHRNDPQTKEDYAKTVDNLEDLKLKLSQEEYAIEKEIRQAYQELKINYQDLELSKLNLAKQKNQLEMMINRYQSGLIPASVVEQLEYVVNQLEYAVNMNMINTLNRQDQFSRAISIGPGY